MNKATLGSLIFSSLLFSGSLWATEADSKADSSKAAKPTTSKIEEAKRAAEIHPGTSEPTIAGNPVVGKQKAFMCKGCHNKVGYKTAYPKVYLVPKLGGQHAEYLTSALMQYRSGERSFATMRAMASNLTDQDIADIAAYYSSTEH